MGWEFPIAAAAGGLFEGLVGKVRERQRRANGMPFPEWAESFFWRA